jgi:hypothetical protein
MLELVTLSSLYKNWAAPLIQRLNECQFAFNPSISNPLASLTISDFEQVLNYINQDRVTLTIHARKALLAKAKSLDIDNNHLSTTYMFLINVLNKNSLGLDIFKTNEMKYLHLSLPHKESINASTNTKAVDIISQFIVSPLVDHIFPTTEDKEIALVQSDLDLRRLTRLLHICSHHNPLQNLYQDDPTADVTSTRDQFISALRKANISISISHYLARYLQQRSLLAILTFAHIHFGESQKITQLLQQLFGEIPSPRVSKITITACSREKVYLEMYSDFASKHPYGKCVLEIIDHSLNDESFTEANPDFASIDVSLDEFSYISPDPLQQETIVNLCEKVLDNTKLFDHEELLVDQLIVPFLTINNNQLAVNKNIINNISLLILLLFKRPELILTAAKPEPMIFEACFNIALRINTPLSQLSLTVIKNYYYCGNVADNHQIFTKLLTDHLIFYNQTPISKNDINQLFIEILNHSTQSNTLHRLIGCYLPLLQFSGGKPDYNIDLKNAFQNNPKQRFLAVYALACRANKGEKKAKKYLDESLPIQQGDLTQPSNLLSALVTNNILSLAECYALQPEGYGIWTKLITHFALSPNNFLRLREQLLHLIKEELRENQREEQKSSAILDEISAIVNHANNADETFLTTNFISEIFQTTRFIRWQKQSNASEILSGIFHPEVQYSPAARTILQQMLNSHKALTISAPPALSSIDISIIEESKPNTTI